MTERDAVVDGSGNLDNLGFFKVHANLSPRTYSISAFILNKPPQPAFDLVNYRSAAEYLSQ